MSKFAFKVEPDRVSLMHNDDELQRAVVLDPPLTEARTKQMKALLLYWAEDRLRKLARAEDISGMFER